MKNNKGFSLMELVVVIAIIGALSAITIPNIISWRSGAAVNAAARAVLADLQDVKMAAIREARVAAVVFDETVTISGKAEQVAYVAFVDANDDMEFDDPESCDKCDTPPCCEDAAPPSCCRDSVILYRKWRDFGDVQLDTGRGGVTFKTNNDGKPAAGFRSNGLPRDNGGGLGAGAVYLKNAGGTTVLSIKMSSAGSIRIDD